MILTTHALTGAVIGKYIKNPWLVVALAIIAHFIMDTFRHGEYVEVFSKNTSIKNSGWKVALDFLIGLIIVSVIIHLQPLAAWQIKNMYIGATASVLPDLVTALYWKFRWNFLKKYYEFHTWVHKYPRKSPERQWNLRNAANDIVISFIDIVLLFL